MESMNNLTPEQLVQRVEEYLHEIKPILDQLTELQVCQPLSVTITSGKIDYRIEWRPEAAELRDTLIELVKCIRKRMLPHELQ